MSWLVAQIKYRSKAVIAGVGALLATAAVGVLTDPGAEKAILALVPAQYLPLATLVVGAIITGIVHQIALGEKPVPVSSTAPETDAVANPSTTILTTVNGTDSTH